MEEQLLGRCDSLRRHDVVRVQNRGAALRHFLTGMRLFEQLFWYLAEIVDETYRRVFLQRVIDTEIE